MKINKDLFLKQSLIGNETDYAPSVYAVKQATDNLATQGAFGADTGTAMTSTDTGITRYTLIIPANSYAIVEGFIIIPGGATARNAICRISINDNGTYSTVTQAGGYCTTLNGNSTNISLGALIKNSQNNIRNIEMQLNMSATKSSSEKPTGRLACLAGTLK